MTFEAGRAPGMWVASDGHWYPAEVHPSYRPTPTQIQTRQGSERTKVRIVSGALLAGILAGCVAIAVILASWNSSSASDLTGKSANQVRAIAFQAAEAEHSVHISTTDGSLDVSSSAGKQTISAGEQGNATVLVVSGVVYLEADANFLQNSLGLPASTGSKYSGRWIAFNSTDPGYQQVAAGVTLASALNEAIPSGPVTLTSTTTIDGKSVVGIVSGLITKDGITGSQTTYVETAAPNLVVESVAHASKSGVAVTTKATFSNWGEPVVVTAPSGAVPSSSLVASGSTA